jgi:pimeloyl-ACP methyl ester carboxylesterase
MEPQYLPSTSEYIEVNRLRHHVRIWNPEGEETFFFLHGHEDCSATWQFVVDLLPRAWRIVAPDWRGHGRTEWSHDGYLFQNYVCDLDALLDHYAPDQYVRLVGHSMGGNTAMLYAGARPRRVDRLVSLDGFGLTDEDPDEFPDRLAAWMDGVRERPEMRASPDLAAMVARLKMANRRLSDEMARFLARELSVEQPDGSLLPAFDPLHRGPRPTTYRFEDTAAVFARISAPVLWIGSDRRLRPGLANGGVEQRRKLIRNCKYAHMPGTGHNMQHDAPAEVAALVAAFFGGEPLPRFDAAEASVRP